MISMPLHNIIGKIQQFIVIKIKNYVPKVAFISNNITIEFGH
jgi:hypothetical protein